MQGFQAWQLWAGTLLCSSDRRYKVSQCNLPSAITPSSMSWLNSQKASHKCHTFRDLPPILFLNDSILVIYTKQFLQATFLRSVENVKAYIWLCVWAGKIRKDRSEILTRGAFEPRRSKQSSLPVLTTYTGDSSSSRSHQSFHQQFLQSMRHLSK